MVRCGRVQLGSAGFCSVGSGSVRHGMDFRARLGEVKYSWVRYGMDFAVGLGSARLGQAGFGYAR